MKLKTIMKVAAVTGLVVLAALHAKASLIAAWDFTGENTVATSTADNFDSGLDNAPILTRGSGAAASAGANSFRTVGFQNNPISTANTDYFQTTLSAASGYTLSLSSIDARFNGTAGFAVSPGVSAQFAYSLDGINFTLIGSSFNLVGVPVAMSQIDLSGISALQNIAESTTVSFRYYASGITTTGGWGFFSSASGVNGLAFGGTVSAAPVPEPSTYIAGLLLALPFGVHGVRYLRNRKRA